MNVLVTGADGFIGSHLCELLVKNGLNVRALCQYNSLGSYGWMDNVDEKIKTNIDLHLGDIRDYDSLLSLSNNIEIIFHLAALIAIPYSYNSPRSYVDTNIIGTLNILQIARNKNIKVIHTSTSEAYGTAQFVPITEKHPLVAQSPYAATKIAADQLALSFNKSFELPVTVLRPFNTYGPRQSARAIIPTIITQLKKNNGILSLGSLNPTRDFNFVEDTCMAFYKISSCEESIGRVVNASSNFEISIQETVEFISEIIQIPYQINTDKNRIRPERSEVNRLCGSNNLIKSLTGWTPKFSGINGFKDGLRKTIDWFDQEKNMNFYREKKYQI